MKTKLEKMLSDNELRRIGEKASYSFRGPLSQDEIANCIDKAIWNASENYKDGQGTKFTSYLYKGVVNECLSTLRFNRTDFQSLDKSKNAYNISGKFNGFERIELMEEIKNCGDPKLVYDRFYLNKTYQELADERNVSGELIRLRLEKCLKNIKSSIS